MSWRRFFRRAQWDRERAAELQSYLEIETDDNVARGMSPDDARRAAHVKLGNTVRIREEIYQFNTVSLFDALGRDLRFAWRGMLRRPTFTLAVVLTLALGIGANTAIFAVVDGVLIKPLPYPDADRLVSVQHLSPSLTAGQPPGMSASMFFTYVDHNRVFEHIGVWNAGGQSVTGLGDPEQARTLWVSHGTLQALGAQPQLGRVFTRDDDAPGASGPQPVILSYGYWQRRFGGSSSVIGRQLSIDGRPSAVVGVMRADFRFLNMQPQPEVILPQRINRAGLMLAGDWFRGVARLKPGVTIDAANADVRRMLPIWLDGYPPPPGATRQMIAALRFTPDIRGLKEDVVGNVAVMLWVLMATIGMVLLIACANVANLMLVRSDERRQERAVRTALGAGRIQLVKEVLVESLVLGACGGAVGVALAYVGLRFLVEWGPTNLPRLEEISLEPRVFAFALFASLVSSVLFGSIPAVKHTRPSGLAPGARGASVSRERQRTRNALVVVQVALALVLLVGSGLMIRTFLALQGIDPGFVAPSSLQTIRIWIPPTQVREAEAVTRMQRDILDGITSIPGVTAASFASAIPFEGRGNANPIFVEGRDADPKTLPPMRRFKFVAPGFFATLGTRLIAGRDLTWRDIEQGGSVALVSENLAKELWRDPAAAIGQRIREPGGQAPFAWREVIGVVQDVYEDGMYVAAPSTVYWPSMMNSFFGGPRLANRAVAVVIRSDQAGSEGLLGQVRRAVWSVNSNLPVFLVFTMEVLYDRSLGTTSFALVMLAIGGVMALALGIIGIYGVLSYVVSHRSREIGIRLALGAEPGALMRMFVRHGLVLAGMGVAAGLAAAVGLTRLMASLLFGVDPLDPTTYAAVLGILLSAAALASYMPARRAAAVDPVETLMME
jgi:predicted permease